ncbi:SAM-dependent methyltransferase [Umezawaea beigongshangensis]|uniref:SAM-dependent methyltransferase n=1 Tax=Umezawaea beigongshangensis TaxID=2780383 RepID=UPI0018F20B40|nr:SAM-dependent methyltransferase [Umezawaea beigongshangensis]
MVRERDWVPQSVDISVPSMARTYDFMLGGGHNFAVDREVGLQIERAMPGLRHAARVNRAFLGRVVRFMTDRGVRQFLDLGSGIPTVSNVHQVAQAEDPECRVVYVDRDPVAVAHSELMLTGNDRAAVVRADMRHPEEILSSPEVKSLLDLDEPVGLLMLLMLHWVPDDSDPAGLVARYLDAVPSGSCVAITHVSGDHQDEKLTRATDVIERSKSPDQVTLRTHAQISALFGECELVEPGLVGCGEWRPRGPGDISDSPSMNMLVYAGVGCKP